MGHAESGDSAPSWQRRARVISAGREGMLVARSRAGWGEILRLWRIGFARLMERRREAVYDGWM